jgi:hypothetical protein
LLLYFDARSGIDAFRFRILYVVAVDSVHQVFSLFLLPALLKFSALLSTVAHGSSSPKFKRQLIQRERLIQIAKENGDWVSFVRVRPD